MTEERKTPSEEAVENEVTRTKRRAEDYLHDPDKSKELLDKAIKKANSKEAHKGPLADVWNNLKALFRMFQAYTRREYTKVPWGSIVLTVVAIIYFVSPIDLIFDWIPVAGFVDDAAVIAFVIKQIKNDLDAYLRWESLKITPANVIDLDNTN
jgi:uncharacterized membrane protein YkvA (DUF1232 family)